MLAESRFAADTKERILDAAEALFVDQGFVATSLRMITAKAGVNLAAVNYHFGSKEELIKAVFERRLGPLNKERIAYLDRLEAQAKGKPLKPEQVVEAMVSAALKLSRDPLKGGAAFLRLLGRTIAEPADTMQRFLPEQYKEVVVRFKVAFAKALPQIPEQELVWRMHFTFGAMTYSMAGNDALQLIASCKLCEADDAESIVRRLIPFLVAGLQAPLPAARTEGKPDVRRAPRKRAA